MSDDSQGREPKATRNKNRKQRRMDKRGNSRPGGVTASCGCRWTRTGDAWRHITPCSTHLLAAKPATDEEMIMMELGA